MVVPTPHESHQAQPIGRNSFLLTKIPSFKIIFPAPTWVVALTLENPVLISAFYASRSIDSPLLSHPFETCSWLLLSSPITSHFVSLLSPLPPIPKPCKHGHTHTHSQVNMENEKSLLILLSLQFFLSHNHVFVPALQVSEFILPLLLKFLLSESLITFTYSLYHPVFNVKCFPEYVSLHSMMINFSTAQFPCTST